MENKKKKETAICTKDLVPVYEMVDNAVFLVNDLTTEYFAVVSPRTLGSQEHILGRYMVARAQTVGLELMLANIQQQLKQLEVDR